MSFHPHTPQSPSQVSPSTTDLSSSMTGSMSSLATTLPTPAHSVNGSSLPYSELAHESNMSDDTPQKRKRALEDTGDREQKKVHIEDRRLGIENLHLDVGEKYLLCRTPHTPSRPRLSDDLFEKLNLTDIAADVARVLPNGEKNAIRKTYKGHIKRLGLNGHFDVVKTDPRSEESFISMLQCPEETWRALFVNNKEVENGLGPETRKQMGKAVSMAKGVVPKSVWDSSVLGELGPLGLAKHKSTAPNTPVPNYAAATLGSQQPRAKSQQNLTPQGGVRPQRNVKKRSYGDSSFEGYGEGYPDDGEGGYSTGEGDMGGPGLKRRKKVLTDILSTADDDLMANLLRQNNTASPFPQQRQPSYGPGMVGA
ncbi:Rox3 mediator complex subunit-domain-containing protein [Coniochaeta sp. 2T2.1]|nr:Rox3 mediator complex subunit-domain-containing protein [Coniochaeta sp. 2T2.1]